MTKEYENLHVRLDPDDYEWLRELAFKTRVSMAEYVRQAVKEYRKQKEDE